MASISSIKNCCAFPFVARCSSGHRRDKNQTKEQLQTITGINSGRDTYDRASDLCNMQFSAYEILGQRRSARGRTERMNLKLKHCSASCPRMISKLPLTYAIFYNWHGVAHFMSSAGCRSEFQNHKTKKKCPHDFVNSLGPTPSDKLVEPAD